MSERLTIVGPEPTGPETGQPIRRRYIEALLLMAKYNPRIRRMLFEDRATALARTGLDLTHGERPILEISSAEQLARSIAEFRVPGVTRRSLRGARHRLLHASCHFALDDA